MSYDIFWYEDPKLFFIYLDSYKLIQDRKMKNKIEELDYQSWLIGTYVKDSLLATVGNMFSKGSKYKFPTEPYSFNKVVKKKDEPLSDVENERLLQQNYMEMLQWTNYFNKRTEKK